MVSVGCQGSSAKTFALRASLRHVLAQISHMNCAPRTRCTLVLGVFTRSRREPPASLHTMARPGSNTEAWCEKLIAELIE